MQLCVSFTLLFSCDNQDEFQNVCIITKALCKNDKSFNTVVSKAQTQKSKSIPWIHILSSFVLSMNIWFDIIYHKNLPAENYEKSIAILSFQS